MKNLKFVVSLTAHDNDSKTMTTKWNRRPRQRKPRIVWAWTLRFSVPKMTPSCKASNYSSGRHHLRTGGTAVHYDLRCTGDLAASE